MDVITKKTWANVGFVWDYVARDDEGNDNLYAFRYWVNGEEVDSSFYADFTNIYREASVYPNQLLFGA